MIVAVELLAATQLAVISILAVVLTCRRIAIARAERRRPLLLDRSMVGRGRYGSVVGTGVRWTGGGLYAGDSEWGERRRVNQKCLADLFHVP